MDERVHAAHPPAPWRMRGLFWAALFRTRDGVTLSSTLQPLFGRNWKLMVLVRYRAGTLRYDELVLGVPARHGLRPGIAVQRMLVNSESSLWGGRRIWGLPKELAHFAWSDGQVRISGQDGLIAELELRQRRSLPLPLPLLVPAFGGRAGHLTYLLARGWARYGGAALRIAAGSQQLGLDPARGPLLSLRAAWFTATFPLPLLLGR